MVQLQRWSHLLHASDENGRDCVPRKSHGEWKKKCNLVTGANSRDNLLKILLSLDRIVVERAMHFYNIPASERRVVRHQNRRVHDAIREIHDRNAWVSDSSDSHGPITFFSSSF